MKQQIFLEILKPDKNGVTILEKFDPDKGNSLDSFLWIHARNRLHNFKRDNYSRLDKPCFNCPLKAYKNKECTKYSKITEERILELETIGFAWEVGKHEGQFTTNDELWNQRIEELKEYKEKHGNCNVPQVYPANKPLGEWVKTQRKHYRLKQQGKKSSMTEERILELEDVGFVWKVGTADNARNDELWNQRFEELKEYKEKHGNCNVPRGYSVNNKQLGYWVNDQRKIYRLKKEGKKSVMTNERILKLEAIGFVWEFQNRRGGKGRASVVPAKNESRNKRNDRGTNKKRKRIAQDEEEPCPKEPTEWERIRRRRIVKERLKNWRCKPGSSIRDLF